MDAIVARGIRVHNLKNIDVHIPHNRIVVITGVSGSGKSSLAFDTLYAEGQRRYVESMSSYARQFLERMEKPEMASMTGVLPAIAIESRNGITNARSTVGTQTELYDFLRLLFARIGKTHCVSCNKVVQKESPQDVALDIKLRFAGQEIVIAFELSFSGSAGKYLNEAREALSRQGYTQAFLGGKCLDLSKVRFADIKREKQLVLIVDRITVKAAAHGRLVDSLESAYRGGKGKLSVISGDQVKRYAEAFYCADCGKTAPEPSPNMFSFNSPLGACPECQGFGRAITIDPALVIPDERKSLEEGAIEPWTKPSTQWEFFQMKKYCQKKKIPFNKPWKELSAREKRALFEGDEGYFGIDEFFAYLQKKTYKTHVRVFLAKYRSYVPCKMCSGARLKPEALKVTIQEKTIATLSELTISALRNFFNAWSPSAYEQEAAGLLLEEIEKRLEFLDEVGLGYLTLARASRTLSGGEAQRIHLATSLGSALVDTLYVLDEPSIGLHERDNALLIGLLKRLRDLGNTVVVVEHDQAMIRAADHVFDLGPRAGENGGEIIFSGPVEKLLVNKQSLTAAYLNGTEKIAMAPARAKKSFKSIFIEGAQAHNLKNIDVEIPLGKLCVLSGVSGSGKSTLLYDVLYSNFLRSKGRLVKEIGAVKRIRGFEAIGDMILIDQSPIGRTPRSNPATYIGVFDEIRKVFARTREARQRKFSAGTFSFNVEGGRCPACKGDGKIKVEMHFLADLYIPCDRCGGTRYQDHVLHIYYRGKNIHDVLELTVEEAIALFEEHERIVGWLEVLRSIGLGYIRLGQAAHTFSAGEAQRIKLALELMERPLGRFMYLLDEPTTGLHYNDIRYLMAAFEKLLAAGHSLLVIEHNMEVIKCADWIIDLGPEGGEAGGSVLVSGSPAEVARTARSHTGRFLQSYLS